MFDVLNMILIVYLLINVELMIVEKFFIINGCLGYILDELC